MPTESLNLIDLSVPQFVNKHSIFFSHEMQEKTLVELPSVGLPGYTPFSNCKGCQSWPIDAGLTNKETETRKCFFAGSLPRFVPDSLEV